MVLHPGLERVGRVGRVGVARSITQGSTFTLTTPRVRFPLVSKVDSFLNFFLHSIESGVQTLYSALTLESANPSLKTW